MKLIIYILSLSLLVGCSVGSVVAPDKVVASLDGKSLYVADRGTNSVMVVTPDDFTIKLKKQMDAPVSDIYPFGDKLIVLTEGVVGKIYFLDASSLNEFTSAEMGYNPSDIVYNDFTKSLWVTQRFNNEVWEVNPENGTIISKVEVGREPIAVELVNGGKEIIVANNLPVVSATSAHISANIDVVDCTDRKTVRQIILPNGTTDIKSIITDPVRNVVYLPHTISRYQIPTNQLDRGWMATSALTIIDIDSAKYINSIILDTPQRGAANPWGGVVTKDGKTLFLALSGTHDVLTIALPSLHNRLERVKSGEKVTPSMRGWNFLPNDAGFLYGIREFIPTNGNGTRSVTVCGDKLIGVNYFSGDIFAINASDDFIDTDSNSGREYILNHKTPLVLTAKQLGTCKLTSSKGRGEAYFHDATLAFQKWQSCATCHPNDARVDGLNWDLLNDGAASLKQTKSMLYSHKTPPSMISGIRENAKKAVRSGFKYIMFAKVDENICADVDAYLLSLEAIPSPYLENGYLSESAKAGKPIYDRECASCHSGQYYTDMKLYKIDWAKGRDKEVAMDTPTLREIWRTAPYLYDGRAVDMKDMLSVHTPNLNLSSKQLNQLECYILSL